jgi:hypothetical protein
MTDIMARVHTPPFNFSHTTVKNKQKLVKPKLLVHILYENVLTRHNLLNYVHQIT